MSAPEANQPPLGHERLLRHLLDAADQDRLPHALLFRGPRGVGKFLSALWLVRALVCGAEGSARPCGTCGPCKRALSDAHPDVLIVDPVASGDEQIRLARLVRREGSEDERVVEEFLALRPLEGGWRAVLLREAERLNVEAQNALLKMLEEPGERVLWILETARCEELLPTIVSRCIAIDFQPLEAAQTARLLARHGVSGPEATLFARWARGSPGEALALCNRGAARMRELLLSDLEGQRTPREVAALLAEVEGEFAGRTERQQARDRARTLLQLACAVLGDLIKLAQGIDPDRLAHGDLAGRPALRPWLASSARGAQALEVVLEALGDIDKNLDPFAVLDQVLIALSGPRAATPLKSVP